MSGELKNTYVKMYPDCDVSELADANVMQWADWYISELSNALRLAKDMMIVNDLSLEHTFEKIDGALSGREWIQ